MRNITKRIFLLFIFACVTSVTTWGQQTATADSLSLPRMDTEPAEPMLLSTKDSAKLTSMENYVSKIKSKKDWANWKPDPKRAMWLAIVLPGAGQIYNRKYWKLPIIYGGFLGCIYAMRWNNQMYLDYSQAYLDIMDDDPTTKSYTQFLHLGTTINSSNESRYKDIFKSRKDKYRRWRDLSFFCMLGVYALSIIDAYVDASLSQFDISDDLSLRLQPAVMSGSTNARRQVSPSSGLNIDNSAIGLHGLLTF